MAKHRDLASIRKENAARAAEQRRLLERMSPALELQIEHGRVTGACVDPSQGSVAKLGDLADELIRKINGPDRS